MCECTCVQCPVIHIFKLLLKCTNRTSGPTQKHPLATVKVSTLPLDGASSADWAAEVVGPLYWGLGALLKMDMEAMVVGVVKCLSLWNI